MRNAAFGHLRCQIAVDHRVELAVQRTEQQRPDESEYSSGFLIPFPGELPAAYEGRKEETDVHKRSSHNTRSHGVNSLIMVSCPDPTDRTPPPRKGRQRRDEK